MISTGSLWNYAWSSFIVIYGVLVIVKGHINVGVRGRSDNYNLDGNVAVFLGILIVLLGLYCFLNPQVFLHK